MKSETPVHQAAVRETESQQPFFNPSGEGAFFSQTAAPVQAFFQPPVQREEGEIGNSHEKTPNETGLPDKLKTGIEHLSGMSMDDVKVHYNSPQPAQLHAHAYAQGSRIHIAPGQEKHLPHEAWHVVQQKQGRVKPTMQMRRKVNINDDVDLEREADIMGARAMQILSGESEMIALPTKGSPPVSPIIQGKFYVDADNPLEEKYYKTIKELLTDMDIDEVIDEIKEDQEEKYLLTTFLYDYGITELVLGDVIYEPKEPEPEPDVSNEVDESPATQAAPTQPVVPQEAVAPARVKLGNFLRVLGYGGNNPRIHPLGTVSNGRTSSVNVHATQYLANTSQKHIAKDTPITTVMNNVFGGNPPTAHHVTAEVHGQKDTRNPHYFYTGKYASNQPDKVKEQDLVKKMTDERKRLNTILKNPNSAVWK